MRRRGEHREVEIKLRVAGAAQARRLLEQHGFRRLGPRVLQDDAILDTAGGRLRKAGVLLRLRRAGKRAALTYKGRAAAGRYKDREEIELALEGAAAARLERLFERLGLRPVFRYQKRRSEYGRPGRPGLIALDETPIGVFLELEGPPAWIDRTARRLGFSAADYITRTYAELYCEHCRRQGRRPGNMLFGAGGGRRLAGAPPIC